MLAGWRCCQDSASVSWLCLVSPQSAKLIPIRFSQAKTGSFTPWLSCFTPATFFHVMKNLRICGKKKQSGCYW